MEKHETNLPALKTEKKEKIWVPCPHENHLRQEGYPPSPQSGQKAPRRLNFSKTERLLKRRDFQRVTAQKNRFVGSLLCLDIRKAPKSRLGIAPSKKYGNSPERNRFKRLIREIFRKNQHQFLETLEIVAYPRSFAKQATFQEMEKEFLKGVRSLSWDI